MASWRYHVPAMSTIVGEAADALAPLLSVGAGAAARDLAERGGTRLSAGALRFLKELRGRSRSRPDDLEDTLGSALASGQLTERDLKQLIVLCGQVNSSTNVKNMVAGHEIHIDTLNMS